MSASFSSQDEVTSTEKLLNVIRGDRSAAVSPSMVGRELFPSKMKRFWRLSQNLPLFRKRVNVGVELGANHLTMVKVAQLSDQRWRLLDLKCIPIGPNIDPSSPAFFDFLRSVVLDFCGSMRNVSLWTSLSSAQVDMKQIRIPKVGKGELSNAVFWTAKREMNFDEKESVFDFELQGEFTEDGVTKIGAMACVAPKGAVRAVKELFTRSGINLSGITTTSFAIQNLFRTQWVTVSHLGTFANLYLGESHSRIAVFYHGNLVLTREIKTGVDSMVDSLLEAFQDAKREPFIELNEWEKVSGLLNLKALSRQDAYDILLSSDSNISSQSKEGIGSQFAEDEIVKLVNPALERLIRQVERTFEYYTRQGNSEPIEQVFVTGAINIRSSILVHIAQNLGVRTTVLDPLNPAGSLNTNIIPPTTAAERTMYTSTLGLALSDNSRTPNLIYTYREKEQNAAVTRINRAILLTFLVLAALTTGFILRQEYHISNRKAEVAQLKQELDQFVPAVDENLIVQVAAKVKQQQQKLKDRINEALGLAVVSELSSMTPPNIRLISMKISVGGLVAEHQPKDKNADQSKKAPRNLVIDGIVQGDQETLEASLTLYLMKLRGSPMFLNPTLQSSDREVYQGIGEVIHFVLNVDLA